MAEQVVSAVLPCPVATAWEPLRDFTAWHVWLPRITKTTMDPGQEQGAVGAVRDLLLSDGSTIREQLVHRDDQRHALHYVFEELTGFPMRSYVGRVRLDPLTPTNETFVHWSGEFDCDAADEAKVRGMLTGNYTSFIAALTAHVAAAGR